MRRPQSCFALTESQFDELAGGAQRSELIGALIAHVGGGASGDARAVGEAHAALSVLVRLAERRRSARALVTLAPYLNGILEFVDALPLGQARLVYRTFVALADAGGAAADAVRGELRMLVNKQLNHVELRFKRLGVVGVVALLLRRAARFDAADSAAAESDVDVDGEDDVVLVARDDNDNDIDNDDNGQRFQSRRRRVVASLSSDGATVVVTLLGALSPSARGRSARRGAGVGAARL